MTANNQLRFAINDRIHDAEVRPSHVPLALLGEFKKREFDLMIELGIKPWADVKDVSAWLEELRGNEW